MSINFQQMSRRENKTNICIVRRNNRKVKWEESSQIIRFNVSSEDHRNPHFNHSGYIKFMVLVHSKYDTEINSDNIQFQYLLFQIKFKKYVNF